ncbi:MAG: hypothetical protein A2622_11870 [Bdellovibrionales bacterium RIFCSPHIGHO2_01_FULL_40_29]|nr:MAG: hypothetical protein A2622_11870 [Bdellovibrionales bacterium RIFCSPHIGHO2_01_FULL_40_29]OFZ35303.1 MAG: hypothetical protein A3D17_08865 [Bdellovibrionales bacterium RIFCSPHIGHO2_02_FULL_40_15]
MAYINSPPSVIAEKLSFTVDIDSILESVSPLFSKYPSVQRSPAFGGWAIQSSNYSYTDGWAKIFAPYNGPNDKSPEWNPVTDYEKSLVCTQDYTKPTELCTPPLKNLIHQLNSLGLNPRRAKIIKLTAKSSSIWHQDGSAKYYQVRLHIPLITNPQATFETDFGKIHLPADGSAYVAKINTNHRVVNEGTEDRYHFVAHVWDTQHITQYHKYDPELNAGEAIHPQPGQWI